ncbi:hypothetical protein [Stenotrophomonas maltophilia]|uniref:hypothetical protein n=1 Tax=Stenotrophomonas maltophilia TaxID=40324 RepID=UPI0015E83386|nr:hypothetical protein [Stenotrophomonas maltophilia]
MLVRRAVAAAAAQPAHGGRPVLDHADAWQRDGLQGSDVIGRITLHEHGEGRHVRCLQALHRVEHRHLALAVGAMAG